MDIIVEYAWNKDNYLKASYQNYMHSRLNKGFKILAGTFLIVLILYYVITMNFTEHAFVISVTVAFLTIYLGRWPIFRWQLKRQFKKYAQKDCLVRWVINETQLKSMVEGIREGIVSWDSITKAVKTKDGFLIYRYPVYHWFPFSGFPGPDQQVLFEMLLERKVKNYRKDKAHK